MKKWMRGSALLLAALGLVSGCASTGGVSAPVAQGNMDQAVAPASSMIRHLNVKVASSGADEDGRTVAARLERAVRDDMAAAKRPVKDGAADLVLAMDVRMVPFDQAGNYHVYDAHLKATAKVADARFPQDLGMTTLKVRSDRKLGKEEALLSAVDKLTGEVVEWSRQMLDPSRCGLLANDITVEVPWYKTRKGQVDYAHGFVKEVGALPGMVLCQMVGHDYANKTMVFRVVYLRDSFPTGLLNVLASKENLHIKPRK